jgi:uncharacterized protein (TIGR02391 family)
MAKRPAPIPVSREWATSEEIEHGIRKLQRRVGELRDLDVADDAKRSVALSNFKDTIREVFGPTSPEFLENEHARMHHGFIHTGMSDAEFQAGYEQGRKLLLGKLNGLIGRLKEKQEDLGGGAAPTPKAFLEYLNLHPRIKGVAGDLFQDGYAWEAVFAASKALINFVKEKSGRDDLDGANLVRTVFSKSNPILVFNELEDQTDADEQEGIMHLFEGAVLAVRNPGGHSFPEGSEQRAVEYLSLISLLAYLVQEARRRRPT